MALKTLFRNRVRSYLFICLLGLLAGGLVAGFSRFPFDTLWSLSSFSSATIGVWMFTTSLIVVTSESPHTAGINAGIYVGVKFVVTDLHKTARLFQAGYAFSDELSVRVLSTLFYGAVPAVLCGALGAILWNGRKGSWYGRALLLLPLLFIAAEGIGMYCRVLKEGRMLFQALLDTACAALYFLAVRRSLFQRNSKNQ